MMKKPITSVGSITRNDKLLALKDIAWPLAIRKDMYHTVIAKILQNIDGYIIKI